MACARTHGRGRVTLAPTASCNPRVTTKLNVYVGLTIVYVGSRAREMIYDRRNLIACTHVKPRLRGPVQNSLRTRNRTKPLVVFVGAGLYKNIKMCVNADTAATVG